MYVVRDLYWYSAAPILLIDLLQETLILATQKPKYIHWSACQRDRCYREITHTDQIRSWPLDAFSAFGLSETDVFSLVSRLSPSMLLW